MTTWRAFLAAGLLISVAAACSDDSSTAGDTTVAVVETSAPDTTLAAETTVAETVVPETTAAQEPEWEAVAAPADCMCSDGSEFTYFVRKGDPAKVVFYLEGGGACFDVGTCGPGSSAYKTTVGAGPDGRTTGVFDFGDPRNPFAGWSIVYVPYCTGDVHIGNQTKDYGDGVVIEHKGFVNGSTALNAMAELFPEATELVVTGESAGSVPTPLYAGLAADLLPDARITVLADGSGAYPDIPGINAVIGGNWGTMNAVPDWPENAGMTPEMWSFPGLFIQAWKHAPDITFARHDYAFDETQAFFSGLVGIPADDLVSLIDKNETQIEAAGVDLFSYISPGDSHTVLGRPEFYTDTQNDLAFVDWVTALVAGEPVADNHCNTTAAGCKG